MKSVCVFCGGNPGKNPAYLAAARSLGVTLAQSGLELVYGGAQVGLMGAVADAALQHGGEVFGVIPEFIAAREIAHLGVTRLEVVSSMHERKARMAAHADAFVALPGGFGTLDELFEILTWSQLGLHRKPCAVLNVEGYFDGLLAFLDRAQDEQLLRPEYRAMLLVESDPARLVERMRAHNPPVVETWLKPGQT
ncbi:MAG: TIGR00730 family Rossman fold protein [Byssovorax sp.]